MVPQEFPEPEREVRFAVVIYGGVSLAIYINGIVQELLRMVRSTALPEDQLTGSEKVYRKLACLVGTRATSDPDEANRATTIHAAPAAHPRTKFVADIFSGTSAGGINALFCAKALATGQSLDQLARLWIEVADIDKLLNDKGSIESPLEVQKPPKSLLNSKWMYLQLLHAFTEMDKNAPDKAGPLVSDLDVFLTTTDLDGLPLPLALPHQNVRERRHRNVFHFVRREDGERDDFRYARDFSDSNNPFFAFAARCTSAFPFAFEPMALCDIFPIISKLDHYRGFPYCDAETSAWQKFYEDYLGSAVSEVAVKFTANGEVAGPPAATRTGASQQAAPFIASGEAVLRPQILEEPVGETPFRFRAFGDGGYLDNKPFSYAIDTICNRSADVPVDRKLIYIEPSPEDIVQKTRTGPDDRPDAVENSLDALITLPRYETVREDLMRLLEWNRNVARLKRVVASLGIGESDSGDGIDRESLAFRAYRRLRHSATVDAMMLRVSKPLKLDPASSQAAAFRELIDAWRPASAPAGVLTEFLETYDFDYLLRAVQCLRFAAVPGRKDRTEDARELAGIKRSIRRAREASLAHLNLQLTPAQREDLNVLAGSQAEIGTSGLGRRAARQRMLNEFLDAGWRETLDWADAALRSFFEGILEREKLHRLLAKYGGLDRFELRDSIVFPITFGTKLGEFGEIDVMRISPRDATPLKGLTDTRETSGIKGDAFGAFGGFLDKEWRKHDILRGRLDGAERLIAAILPGEDHATRDLRIRLVMDAQKEIALDWEANYAGL